jgi:hypothetical protein
LLSSATRLWSWHCSLAPLALPITSRQCSGAWGHGRCLRGLPCVRSREVTVHAPSGFAPLFDDDGRRCPSGVIGLPGRGDRRASSQHSIARSGKPRRLVRVHRQPYNAHICSIHPRDHNKAFTRGDCRATAVPVCSK